MTRNQRIELARLALGIGVAFALATGTVMRWLEKGWRP